MTDPELQPKTAESSSPPTLPTSLPESKQPPKKPGSPDDALPPVHPPNAGFILQLFLIPMIIVTIIVVVCMLFNWLAHMGSDPTDLVRDLRRLNEGSWQKAFTLSNLLRDRKHAYLKEDAVLAQELADILQAELDDGSMDESRILLRVYLARALGEFRVETPLPVLIETATTQRDEREVDVRYAAIEAIALLAQNLESEKLQARKDLLEALIVTSQERSNNPDLQHAKGELRSAAAFALGVIGGAEADERLRRLLDDSHPNARYNAATGLARRGDERSLTVLMEMLDPDNQQVVKGEQSKSQMDRKRSLVIMNGIRATQQLYEANPDADFSEVRQQLQSLADSDLPRPLRLQATEALSRMKSD